jgi:hypothetical protein
MRLCVPKPFGLQCIGDRKAKRELPGSLRNYHLKKEAVMSNSEKSTVSGNDLVEKVKQFILEEKDQNQK